MDIEGYRREKKRFVAEPISENRIEKNHIRGAVRQKTP